MTGQLREVLSHSSDFIIGKEDKIKLALTCILAKGHLLIEDIPGVGKTTMVKYLSRTLGLEMGRIQFTNDLLPSDILGVHIFDSGKGEFTFKKGPIFSQMILADELNRATPKTQSALLQVMEEYHVTLDGENYQLDAPFFVVATQNPNEQVGTNLLPEGQMDRFLMRLHLGIPERADELNLLRGEKIQNKLEEITPLLSPDEIMKHQEEVEKVFASDSLLNYIIDILSHTRVKEQLTSLSPRAGLDITRAAKSWAYLDGRDHVIPEDVQLVTPSVIGHRITPHHRGAIDYGQQLTQELIKEIEVR